MEDIPIAVSDKGEIIYVRARDDSIKEDGFGMSYLAHAIYKKLHKNNRIKILND